MLLYAHVLLRILPSVPAELLLLALCLLLVGTLGGYVYAQWQAQWWLWIAGIDRAFLAYSSSAWPQGGLHAHQYRLKAASVVVSANCGSGEFVCIQQVILLLV